MTINNDINLYIYKPFQLSEKIKCNMSTKPIIISKHDNEDYELVLNESLLLLDKNDRIIVPLIYDSLKWKLNIIFINDDTINEYSGTMTFDKENIIYTLNKWDSDSYVETTTPIKISAKDNEGNFTNEFYLKLKSIAPINHNFRQVFISIWKKM